MGTFFIDKGSTITLARGDIFTYCSRRYFDGPAYISTICSDSFIEDLVFNLEPKSYSFPSLDPATGLNVVTAVGTAVHRRYTSQGIVSENITATFTIKFNFQSVSTGWYSISPVGIKITPSTFRVTTVYSSGTSTSPYGEINYSAVPFPISYRIMNRFCANGILCGTNSNISQGRA